MTEIKIYEVGGSLRNELLGLDASDRDFSVLAPSYNHMREYLLARGATFYQERPQFLNIKAKLPELGSVDFTLARKESFYTDARHPDSVSPAETIEDDLRRRDFTMNAIAREVGTKTLIDPFDGQEAIANRSIMAVGKAYDRFKEDRMRIIRAIRFEAQLGFTIEKETRNAMEHFIADDFEAVSSEALQVELSKCFMSNTPASIFALAAYPQAVILMKKRAIRLNPTLKK